MFISQQTFDNCYFENRKLNFNLNLNWKWQPK